MSDDLQARITRLERSNRRWKVLALALGVVVAGGVFLAGHQLVRAKAQAQAARDAERHARQLAEEAAAKKR